jgi:hypothetical protein
LAGIEEIALMPVELVSAQEAMTLMAQGEQLSCIIDARSEDEFKLDHLPWR